jgi:hypothetical protein
MSTVYGMLIPELMINLMLDINLWFWRPIGTIKQKFNLFTQYIDTPFNNTFMGTRKKICLEQHTIPNVQKHYKNMREVWQA